jgi:hypothetical protein
MHILLLFNAPLLFCRYLWFSSCAVGFSAVIFALKVVLFHDSPGYSSVFGFSLPTKVRQLWPLRDRCVGRCFTGEALPWYPGSWIRLIALCVTRVSNKSSCAENDEDCEGCT